MRLVLLLLALAGCATQPVQQPGAVVTADAITTPQPVLLSQGTYSVPVRWAPYSEPVSMLKVWVGKSTSSMSVAAMTGWTATSVTVGGLKKNQTYYFRMTAVDTNALESAPSATVLYNSKQGGSAPPAGSTAQ